MTLTQILSKLKSLVYSKTETDTLLGNKAASSHTHSEYVPKSGGAVMTGAELGRTVNTSSFSLWGGTDHSDGAKIDLYGKGHSTYSGCAFIRTIDANNNVYQMALKPDGTLTWGSKNIAMTEDVVPRSGGGILTGIYLGRNVNNDLLELAGGSSWNNGGSFVAYGKDQPDYGGSCLIHAANGTNETHMWINPNGTATLGSKNLAMQEDTIPRSGGATITGQRFSRTVDDNELVFSGGTDWHNSATLALHSKGWYQTPGGIWMQPCNDITSSIMQLLPDGTWTWQGTAVQLVSDQRLKQQISEIDDRLLDAWEDVELSQFKYNDAVDQKGDNARLHTGYVVQQIDQACKEHGVDVSAYGLYCHEEYPEETEEVEVEQEDGTKTKERKVIREASEHYSLRYTETLVVECAFLRREVKRLSERLSKLEQPSTSEK